MVNRFDVYLVNLDSEVSKDPKNTRPAVIISPDEMNRHISTVLVAPLSSTKLLYPSRVPIEFLGNSRAVILDQIRTLDKERLVKKIGEIDPSAKRSIIGKLQEMFAE
ncbi:MAG TPA: type II toxin-antitoxin system PemK/MazF family toxin [Pyrinomonadaceae bacterium]|nr:type II toxin-antitoxin system PemK/MazF family toxin [Pyrinomonadaceae bacterium]